LFERHCSPDEQTEYRRRLRICEDLLAWRYPDAVRLSAYPTERHDGPIGIRLLEEREPWLAPWQGVVLDVGGRFVLTTRSQAERLGGSLMWRSGRPSHYVYAG
jgi:pyoverdine/dityrosine biosynthesis protein Dit1